MKRPLCLLCFLFVSLVMLFVTLFYDKRMEKALPDNRSRLRLQGTIYAMEEKQGKSIIYLKDVDSHQQDVDSHQQDVDSNQQDVDSHQQDVYSNQQDVDSHQQNIHSYQKVICYLSSQASNIDSLKIGYRVLIEGTVRHFEASENPGQFNMALHYKTMNIDYAMSNCQAEVLKPSVNVYKNSLYQIKKTLSEVLDRSLLEDDAGVLKAMLFGDKSSMSEEIKGLYQRTGIAHIVAVSGVHIALWGMAVCKFLRRLYMPLWMANFLALFFVISYGILTGSQASAIRSVIMFSLFLFAQIVNRTYDLLTAMMLSATLLLFVNPFYTFHSGFLLSFGAVGGIALILPLYHQLFHKKQLTKGILYEELSSFQKWKQKLLGFIVSSYSVSLCVTIFSLPIQIYFFYTFPIYSIFLNLLIGPMISVLMILAMLGAVFGWIWLPIGRFFLYPCHLILLWYENLCKLFDGMPFAHPVIGRPGVFSVIFYYVVLAGVLIFINYYISKDEEESCIKLCKKVMALLVLVGNILVISIPIRTNTFLTMLSVGQGDCFVVEEKSGFNILIDGGSSTVKEVGKYRIAPYLKSRGISTLDYVFLSHGDTDHMNGVLEILQDENNNHIKISCLVLTLCSQNNEKYEELLQAAYKKGVKLVYLKAGDQIKCGECIITCLYPEFGYTKENNWISEAWERKDKTRAVLDENDSSMVLHMKIKDKALLFMGDLSSQYEAEVFQSKFWENTQQKVDILKVGHHGSKYSTSKELLDAIEPTVGFISAGADNKYGHPNIETLERLEKAGTVPFSTIQYGAVTVKVLKNGVWRVIPYKK